MQNAFFVTVNQMHLFSKPFSGRQYA